MARNADESMKAEATPTGKLAEPGPQEVKVATGSCRTRNQASAIRAATDSWWTEMVRMRSRRS